MSCSKVMHGDCSRCGKVGQNHFKRAWIAYSEEQERKQIQHAFFQAKKKFPTKAQLRQQYRLF